MQSIVSNGIRLSTLGPIALWSIAGCAAGYIGGDYLATLLHQTSQHLIYGGAGLLFVGALTTLTVTQPSMRVERAVSKWERSRARLLQAINDTPGNSVEAKSARARLWTMLKNVDDAAANGPAFRSRPQHVDLIDESIALLAARSERLMLPDPDRADA
jgi:hypothetical protein